VRRGGPPPSGLSLRRRLLEWQQLHTKEEERGQRSDGWLEGAGDRRLGGGDAPETSEEEAESQGGSAHDHEGGEHHHADQVAHRMNLPRRRPEQHGDATQSRRLLQVAARFGQVVGAMFGDPKMPQRVGQDQRIVYLGGERAGSLERRDRGWIVVPDDLVKGADPELRLSFTADVTQAPVELSGPLEEGELVSNIVRDLPRSRQSPRETERG